MVMDHSFEQIAYENRIKRLLADGSEDQFGFYLSLSERVILRVYNPKQASWSEDMVEKGGMKYWLQTQIYPYLLESEKEQEFRKIFLNDELLQKYQEGHRRITLGYCCRKGQFTTYYRVEIELLQHPDTGCIECCAVWKDDTITYYNQVISDLLLKKKYRLAGVINIKEKKLCVRKQVLKDFDVEVDCSLDYDEFLKVFCTARIQKKEWQWFLQSASLEYMIENLKIAGSYSFSIKNIEKKIERYHYEWLDQNCDEVVFVIEDHTAEVEQDALTGYYNRTGFLREAEKILQENKKEYQFAILYFNIRKFSGLNEVYGYEKGDRILCSYMDHIQNSFLRPLVLGRVAADRFQALVDVKNLDLDSLGNVLHYPMQLGSLQVEIYGKCGIYYIPDDSTADISQMCDFAKTAKYKISNQYLRPYEIYDEKMGREDGQKNLVLLNLEKALQKEEFVIHYQPVVDGQTKKVVSAEALVRWNIPGVDDMIPAVFVPELEESGYITKLDTYIDRTVHEFQKKRYQEGKKIVPIAVNLSRMDLMDEEIMENISRKIQESIVPRKYFRYEVIESAYTQISEKGEAFLASLREHGVQILLDDFGSGNSTFETVRDYTFDALKLDRGFVHKIGENQKNNAIVWTIIQMAHRMGMKVVAEGIENEIQDEFLRKCNCDYLQGFYYYKPMSVTEFTELLDK